MRRVFAWVGPFFALACATAQAPCPAPVAPAETAKVHGSGGLSPQANSDTAGVDAPADEKRPGLTVPETRTQAVIAEVVKRNRASVRACYEKALKTSPGLRGTLTLRFTINPKGVVTAAEVNEARSDLAVPGLSECAVDAIRSIRFPKSSRGFESNVNYPFDFRS